MANTPVAPHSWAISNTSPYSFYRLVGAHVSTKAFFWWIVCAVFHFSALDTIGSHETYAQVPLNVGWKIFRFLQQYVQSDCPFSFDLLFVCPL